MTRFRPRLRHLLTFAFVLVAIVPVLFLGIWVERTAKQKEIDAVADKHLLLARNVTAALDRYAHDTRAVFQYFIPQLIAGDASSAAIELAEKIGFRHFCLIDDEGNITSTIPVIEDVSTPTAEHLFDRLGLTPASGDVTFSDVMADVQGRPTIFLTKRLSSEQTVVASLGTEYIISLQQAIAFGQKGHAAITDSNGNLIAHPNRSWWESMKNISKVKPVARMMAGETGVTTIYSPALKRDMISGFTTVRETGWGVMVPQPLEELVARAAEVERVALIVILMGLVVAAVIGWLLAGLMVRPLEAVVVATQDIVRGDLDTRVPMHHGLIPVELRELGRSFNAMAKDVQSNMATREQAQSAVKKLNAELENRIGERTISLRQEIKERQRAEEEMLRSEDRFRDFAECSADWFWETDSDLRFSFMSSAAEQKTGVPNDLIIGNSRQDLTVDDVNSAAWRSHLQDLRDRKPFRQFEYMRMSHDGQSQYVTTSGKPLFDDKGRFLGYRGTGSNVTDRKHLEAELRRVQKMEALGNLAGGLAHNLNNLLLPIVGLSELTAKDLPAGSESRQNLEKVLHASLTAEALVRQIMEFGLADEAVRDKIDIRQVLERQLELMPTATPSTISTEISLDDDVGSVLANPAQIESVILNIILNAVAAIGEETGRIGVSLCRVDLGEDDAECLDEAAEGDFAKLEIEDSGHGMDEETLAQVFEPFFTTKKEGEGTGLGLSSAQGIIRSHGGFIRVSSEAGIGSRFTVYLPIVETGYEGLRRRG